MTTDAVRESLSDRHARARRQVAEELGLITLAEAHRIKLDPVLAVFVYRFRAEAPQQARTIAEALQLDYGLVLRADAVLEEAGLIRRDSPPQAVRT